MSGWSHWRACGEHGIEPCDCDEAAKHDLWRLLRDDGVWLGTVQQFQENGPFYGNTAHGRTGAYKERINCQVRVELMVEAKR